MPAIRHQINIDATPRAVWRALTTSEGLCGWWVDAARVDAREGGMIVLTSEGDDGEPMEERGIFHQFRPMRRIEIAWDKHGAATSRGSHLQFNVARDGEETRVSIVHSGSEALVDDDERAALVKTWKQAMLALRSLLEET